MMDTDVGGGVLTFLAVIAIGGGYWLGGGIGILLGLILLALLLIILAS